MKINPSSKIINPYQKIQPISKIEKAKAANNQDQLEISSKAKELLDSKAAKEREDNIASLKSQIENGTYEVNSKALADNLFNKWFK